ncbi:ATP-binding protein [Longimicrobium sp.]|jgi:PAS domain S-box-containing protein|uniref:hybrid sensor histidine kinase/response regulator n=1 Tax=Longimicrobium sp. TaxID=2029185 RepID=UPI002F9593CC
MTQAAEAVAGSRARILMVDDRPENLMALEAIMEPLGHEMVRANSGEEALRHVLLHDFAVILLDVQMPGINGFETAQLIKSRERSRSTPIIFLTAISKDEQYVFTGYSVGAVDYLSKPFNPDVLRSKVAVFIDLYLKTEQLKDQEKRLRESEVRELELAHRARLLESEARMAEIVGSALEAILTFDDERRITLFNSAAERTFGRPAADAMGLSFDELLSPAFRGVALEEMCAAAAARAASVLEGKSPDDDALHEHAFEGMRANGEVFPLEGSISCLQLDSERVYTVIGRDVTERKRAEEALRKQAAELKSLNRQLQARQRELENAMASRSRFYASMSHELRTPINAILGYSSLLLDSIYGPLNPEQARGIERAHAAAKHLLELVNDILDLSKIEAGKVDIEVQPAAFPSLVQDLFVTVRPLADEHGSELTLESDGDAVITTDARRVRQILLNLLSNAIKFGDGKPITVRCHKREDGGMEVDVIDRGRGIEPQDLDRIFDEFVQLADPDQQVGTGLGLPISRRLAVLLGGTLTVESTVGDGSTFRLCLPPKLDMRLISGEGLPLPTATSDPVHPASAEAIDDDEPVDDEAARGEPADDGTSSEGGIDEELPADAAEPSPARLAS